LMVAALLESERKAQSIAINTTLIARVITGIVQVKSVGRVLSTD
jgi:hypothetical protein